jgi:hypothetical protein
MNVKLTKERDEIYFKSITQYDFEVDGNPISVLVEEDSNSTKYIYLDGDNKSEQAPDWIVALGKDDFGDLIFESMLKNCDLKQLKVGAIIEPDSGFGF